MKVAYVTPYYNGDVDGRFGRFHDWVHALRDMDSPPFDFDVFALTASNEDSTLSSRPHAFLGDATSLWGTKQNKVEFALNAPRLVRDLRQEQFDIVHVLTADLIAHPIARLFGGKPLVVGPDIQGYFPGRKGNRWNQTGMPALKNRAKYHLKETILQTSTPERVVALSEYQKQLISTLPVPADRISLLPPGVDPIFSPGAERTGDGTSYLYVGDLSKYKGYPLFIRALSQLPEEMDWEATIIGKGDVQDGRLDELGIRERVDLIGYVPRDELPPYYRRADFFVMPSVDENGPNTIVEALACGTPILATNRPGINEYTPEGAGIHFERTVPDILEALQRAELNKASLTKTAREVASSFEIGHTIDALQEIYATTLKET